MQPMIRIPIRAGLALILTLGLTVSHPLPSFAAGVTIRILETFDPSQVTVAPGTTITWVNESGNRHRVSTTAGPSEFDSGNLEAGQRFSVTLDTVGTYEYRDERNPGDSAYWARIVVAADAPAQTPAPGPSGGPIAPLPTTGDVGMAGEVFRPSAVTIATGGSVTWRNDDDRAHTVTATNSGFDSGTVSPGQSYTRSFPNAGTYSYLCLIHPNMTGTVIVTTPGVAPPPPAPTPVPTPAPEPTPVTPPAPGSIRAIDFAFQPSSLTVAVGSRVSFVNGGKAPHTMTARDGSFDSGIVNGGGTWARTFPTPGTYAFLCSLHPQMVGTVRVTDGTGGVPPPAPTPVATSRPAPPAGPDVYAILDFTFEPATILVPVGSTVSWTNQGLAPHTVTDRAGSFDSGLIETGRSWSHTFAQAGTFAIWCVIHPTMTGTVNVTAAAGAAPGLASPSLATTPSATTGVPSPSPTVVGGVAGQDAGNTDGATGDPAGDAIETVLPTRQTSLTDVLGIGLAALMTGSGTILFLRTISGTVRRTERG